ncbi:MAG: hypothetical protein KDD10_28870 [Phaeodactylibacter sp.]|nr:hypothetical protein [Phaeodactylibacter sp.]MCB9292749.1 hypothetical protein [Lewinellaceae bacterium]
MNLQIAKDQIKADYSAIWKKPGLVFYLPALFFQILKNRLYSPKDVVYLTETALSGHLPLMSRPLPEHHKITAIQAFAAFEPLAKQRMAEEGWGDRYLQQVSSRFAGGDYALALFREGSPAAYVFISEQHADFQQVGIKTPLPAGHFTGYDGYTFRKWRGKRLWPLLLAAMFRHMKEKGFKTWWFWVMKHNTVTLKVHCHLGVGRVIKIMSQCYRFGFRIKKTREADFSLCKLLDEKHHNGKNA